MQSIVLRETLDPTEDEWTFNRIQLPNVHQKLSKSGENQFYGLQLSFSNSPPQLKLGLSLYPTNRILNSDDPRAFVLCSFTAIPPFKFPDAPPSVAVDYMKRFFLKGLTLNGRHFRFYGHSNSQLRSRSCFLREATTDEELDARIYQYGELSRIFGAAKRSKRIGLLFSGATIDWELRPEHTEDIPDLEGPPNSKGERPLYSDGCGLMALRFAQQLARKKKIIFNGKKYTPSVIQIRYRGYKGVLMVHPPLDKLPEEQRKIADTSKEDAPSATVKTPAKGKSIRTRPPPQPARFRPQAGQAAAATSTAIPPARPARVPKPPLEKPQTLVQFRHSMRKFKVGAEGDNTFSVVDDGGFSKPFVYGRLNNDIVTLLSSLGITNETFLRKQNEYLEKLGRAHTTYETAFEVLSAIGKHEEAERVLLDGLDHPQVQRSIKAAISKEIAAFKKEGNEKKKIRMVVEDSRYVFGVCDPLGVLKAGEVFVNFTMTRGGVRALHGVYVLVYRNPCMHPGDCLKLRAVHRRELVHLVDCVVFAAAGKYAAPSLSSGGDLDGDKFTVIWDPDLIPKVIAEPYTYPPVKTREQLTVTRQDLAAHFAGYNSISMGQAAKLHHDWVRCSKEGAMSKECQELNALYSQCVDGARIRIPDRLRKPPTPTDPFIVDILNDEATSFAQNWLAQQEDLPVEQEDADAIISVLVTTQNQTLVLTEVEVIRKCIRLARKYQVDLRPYFPHFNWSALSTSEKYEICQALQLSEEDRKMVWNSLMQSRIINPAIVRTRDLGHPALRLQKLYSSHKVGLSAFFEYLRRAFRDYRRTLVIMRTDDRFSVGIFIRGEVEWVNDVLVDDPDSPTQLRPHVQPRHQYRGTQPKTQKQQTTLLGYPVDENVVVCAFMPNSQEKMSQYKQTTPGYLLHCSNGRFQLYDRIEANTWIYINRPPFNSTNEIQTSIALGMINTYTSKQIGRINRTPVTEIEIHVVSNRDRVAQEIFDLRFQDVPTEDRLRRMGGLAAPYERNDLRNVDWTGRDQLRIIFTAKRDEVLRCIQSASDDELHAAMGFGLQHHEQERAFWIFDAMCRRPDPQTDRIALWCAQYPQLVFGLLHHLLPSDTEHLLEVPWSWHREEILRALLLCANRSAIAVLVGLEKLKQDLLELDSDGFCDILWFASLTVRHRQTAQEVLLTLFEQRTTTETPPSITYLHKQALSIAFDRIEEAWEEVHCNETGWPTKQREAPARVPLLPPIQQTENGPIVVPVDSIFQSKKAPTVRAQVRVDATSSVRIHSHVRLAPASKPELETANAWLQREVLDGIVKQARKGEVEIQLCQHPPPEFEKMEWNMYDAGSIATGEAMMNALRRLSKDQSEACSFWRIIVGETSGEVVPETYERIKGDDPAMEGLNPSQQAAIVSATSSQISLIWGPPGTGKTTVVVAILKYLCGQLEEGSRILMTASTHNAVDNVLERFARANILPEEQVLRAATDPGKVSKSVMRFTVDARLGGSPTDDPKLIKKAEKRVKEAKIAFTTCAGAGLGLMRKSNFDIVLIDEASQITEPVALIPLVKGCRRAILVGDHVQLRPTVKPLGVTFESDVSLFERLYVSTDHEGISKSMLEIQYRFPRVLAEFPSREFYEGRLQTGNDDREELEVRLRRTTFPWPHDPDGLLFPNAFVNCAAEEDQGGQSKSNEEQAKLTKRIVDLISSVPDGAPPHQSRPEIAVLTPYKKQVELVRTLVSSEVKVSTVDGFQGREADFIIYTSVRSNFNNDIGFLDDRRRLNVAWTRAKYARILIGDRRTLEGSELWKRAIEDCHEVVLQ